MIKVLDLGLIGIARDHSIVELNTGGVKLGIQLSDCSVQSVHLSHEGIVGLGELGRLGLGGGELLLESSAIGPGTIDLVSEVGDGAVQGSNLVGESSVGLLELTDSGGEVVAGDSQVVDFNSSGVELGLEISNGLVES